MPGGRTVSRKISEKTWLTGILILGVMHGLLYIFLVPPWQHYDEPGHFEYAWLLANRPGLPAPGDYDQPIRREIAASMIELGFFDNLDFRPNLIAQTEPVWIGISQTSDSPLYYWLVALPLRLLSSTDVVIQLQLGRIISLLLFLTSLITAYGILTELTLPGNPLRLLVPLTLALLPGFVDIMTAINNDVGAVAAFSLFLWLSLRMIQRGFHWLRLIGLSCAASLCLLTKGTVAIALPLLAVPLLLSLLRRPLWRWLSWVVILTGGIALLWYGLVWDSPQGWFSESQQADAMRVAAHTPLGEYAFQIRSTSGQPPPKLVHALPYPSVVSLQSNTITLGVWMWADQAGNFLFPNLIVDGQPQAAETVALTTSPAFFARAYPIPADAARVQIMLTAHKRTDIAAFSVYFDGIVLAEGDFSAQNPPQFDTPLASRGSWGGQPFLNNVSSASAEQSGPRIHPRIEKTLDRILPFQPSVVLQSLLNLPVTGWYFRVTSENLLQTFWGKFSWGNIPLPEITYTLLKTASLAGVILALSALGLYRRSLPWNSLVFLALAGILVWSAALLRGADVITQTIFFPGARYAYPVIVPTVILLIAGWMLLPAWLARKIPPIGALFIALYMLLILWLDILSLATIVNYYR